MTDQQRNLRSARSHPPDVLPFSSPSFLRSPRDRDDDRPEPTPRDSTGPVPSPTPTDPSSTPQTPDASPAEGASSGTSSDRVPTPSSTSASEASRRSRSSSRHSSTPTPTHQQLPDAQPSPPIQPKFTDEELRILDRFIDYATPALSKVLEDKLVAELERREQIASKYFYAAQVRHPTGLEYTPYFTPYHRVRPSRHTPAPSEAEDARAPSPASDRTRSDTPRSASRASNILARDQAAPPAQQGHRTPGSHASSPHSQPRQHDTDRRRVVHSNSPQVSLNRSLQSPQSLNQSHHGSDRSPLIDLDASDQSPSAFVPIREQIHNRGSANSHRSHVTPPVSVQPMAPPSRRRTIDTTAPLEPLDVEPPTQQSLLSPIHGPSELTMSVPQRGFYLSPHGCYYRAEDLHRAFPQGIPATYYRIPETGFMSTMTAIVDLLGLGNPNPPPQTLAGRFNKESIMTSFKMRYSGHAADNLPTFINQFLQTAQSISLAPCFAGIILQAVLTHTAAKAYSCWSTELYSRYGKQITHLPLNHVVTALTLEFWTEEVQQHHIVQMRAALKQKPDERTDFFVVRFDEEITHLHLPEHQKISYLANALLNFPTNAMSAGITYRELKANLLAAARFERLPQESATATTATHTALLPAPKTAVIHSSSTATAQHPAAAVNSISSDIAAVINPLVQKLDALQQSLQRTLPTQPPPQDRYQRNDQTNRDRPQHQQGSNQNRSQQQQQRTGSNWRTPFIANAYCTHCKRNGHDINVCRSAKKARQGDDSTDEARQQNARTSTPANPQPTQAPAAAGQGDGNRSSTK